jgi:hypothetical protein
MPLNISFFVLRFRSDWCLLWYLVVFLGNIHPQVQPRASQLSCFSFGCDFGIAAEYFEINLKLWSHAPHPRSTLVVIFNLSMLRKGLFILCDVACCQPWMKVKKNLSSCQWIMDFAFTSWNPKAWPSCCYFLARTSLWIRYHACKVGPTEERLVRTAPWGLSYPAFLGRSRPPNAGNALGLEVMAAGSVSRYLQLKTSRHLGSQPS